MSIVLVLKLILARLKYAPLISRYKHSPERHIIDIDVKRWSDELSWNFNTSTVNKIIRLLLFKPQFRNLFFFRIKSNSKILKLICPPDISLCIADDCVEIEGGGVYFEHAFSTIVAVRHIGKNCLIRQLTTFGVKSKNRHEDRPWIGDNVDFGANVTCIGNIRIGNNAIIAAGSVVVKDVPDNAIVAGNPAKIIKYRDNTTHN